MFWRDIQCTVYVFRLYTISINLQIVYAKLSKTISFHVIWWIYGNSLRMKEKKRKQNEHLFVKFSCQKWCKQIISVLTRIEKRHGQIVVNGWDSPKIMQNKNLKMKIFVCKIYLHLHSNAFQNDFERQIYFHFISFYVMSFPRWLRFLWCIVSFFSINCSISVEWYYSKSFSFLFFLVDIQIWSRRAGNIYHMNHFNIKLWNRVLAIRNIL